MSKRTSIYKYLYLELGDKWYPGYDYENMLTAENQLQGLYKFIGTGVIEGWEVTKLSDYVLEQKSLITAWRNNPDSELGQRYLALGLRPDVQVRLASTENIVSLSGLLAIDNITLASGDKVLVKNQSTASQNGIYTVSAGSWSRSDELNSPVDFVSNFIVLVSEGNVYSNTVWVMSNPPISGVVIGSTNIYFEDAFKQVIRVTPGYGIVDLFSARTYETSYIRHQSESIYYVWADKSLCLNSEGICAIVSVDNEFYDSISEATYLADVTFTADPVSGIATIYSIEYSDRRNNLKNLASALEDALSKTFYRHVHLGNSDTPSKILLSTQLILDCYAPTSSTIFDVKIQSDLPLAERSNFIWSSANYGLPEVRLNNIKLDETEYTLNPSIGRIYLKNSLETGNLLQLVLPLSSQKYLFPNTDETSLFSGVIKLTDGSTQTINNQTTYKTFSWSDLYYHPALVYLKDVLIDPKFYTINSNQGTIVFSLNLPSYSTYTLSDVSLVVESLGREIQSKLSGKRVKDINASSFSRGKLNSKRIAKLDHVGQNRYKETAYTKPILRLFSEGNKTVFYPEVTSNDLQYNSKLYFLGSSKNLTSKSKLISTKTGLLQSSTYLDNSYLSSWNIDNGYIKDVQDEILQADNFSNYFKRIYVLSSNGKLYRSSNNGIGWSVIKSPIEGNNTVPVIISSFYVSSQWEEVEQGILLVKKWYTNIVIGTNFGAYYVRILEGQTEQDWVWTKITRIKDTNGSPSTFSSVNSVLDMTLMSTTTDPETKITTKSFTNVLFIGANNGFYIGNYGEVQKYSSDVVKNIYWIQDGAANQNLNNIIWATDTTAWITQSAYFEATDTSTNWYQPLATNTPSYSDCLVSTVGNVNLTSGSTPQIVDGVTLANNNRILVKNQTNPIENGIYVCTNASSRIWARSADTFTSSKKVAILSGTVNASSEWVSEKSSVGNFGTQPNYWKIFKFKVFENLSSVIKDIDKRAGYSQYYIAHNSGISKITETFDYLAPTRLNLNWYSYNGTIECIDILNQSGSSYELIYVGSDRGLFVSTQSLWDNTLSYDNWKRPYSQFFSTDQLSIYNAYTLEEITSGYTVNASNQSITFDTNRNLWDAFVYEREYVDFYVDSWTGNGSSVVIYYKDKPSIYPYTLDPTLGKISFLSSLSKADKNSIKITISRPGAYISNVGTNPHSEQIRAFVIDENPVAKLSKDFNPEDLNIYLDKPTALNSSNTLIEIRLSSTIKEIFTISVDPESYEVTIPYARSSSTIYFTGATVHVISTKNVLGIEDFITLNQNKQTYHLSSVDNANTLQLSLNIQTTLGDIFKNFAESPTLGEDERGLVKTLLASSLNPNIYDTRASDSSVYSGNEPSLSEKTYNPKVIYSIYNPSKSGSNMKIGTDAGVWNYDGTKWVLDSNLNGASRSYYLKSVGSTLKLGADNGLWNKNTLWSQSSLYTQAQFSYVSGSWFGGTFEAFGKEDGLAFINVPSNSTTFTSDHYDLVDNKNVYGLYKDQFIRMSTDSQGNNVQTKVDALYICAEDGLYGVTSGSRGTAYSSLLDGREMFGGSLSVKFYDIFRPLATPPSTNAPVPMFILTSNGLLKVRNWRWCDPTENELTFETESTFLSGLSCNCYTLYTSAGTPGKSKIFIGTNDGVYRSLNEGSSFEKCERILGGRVSVYSLVNFSSTYTENSVSVTKQVILAGTEYGLWYSTDDGDTWYLSGNPNEFNAYPVEFSSTISNSYSFNAGYLAQTFKPISGQTQVFKISGYFELQDLKTNPLYEASLNNTITAAIYLTDGNGIPTTPIALSNNTAISNLISNGFYNTSNSIGSIISQGFTGNSGFILSGFSSNSISSDLLLARDIKYSGFYSINLPVTLPNSTSTYALVLQENNVGGLSIVRWKKSSASNPYTFGRSYSSNNGTSWTALNSSDDFYFKVNFAGTNQYSETIEIVGRNNSLNTNNWLLGDNLGLIVNDSGYLTTDLKFAMSMVIDDSYSILNAFGTSSFEAEINGFIDRIYDRTDSVVISTLFPKTYASQYIFNNKTSDRTNGFINNRTQLKSNISALRQNGINSVLLESINASITSMNPEAIVETILKVDDETNNQLRVQAIVDYLNSVSSLGLSELKSWYAQTDYQENLIPKTALNVNPITLSLNGIDTFTWSTATYPYLEVSVNDIIQSSGYSINPSLGQITFSTPLLLTDILKVTLRADWDGQANSIKSSDNIRTYFVNKWANSYIPFSTIFADGKNISEYTADEIVTTAESSWNDLGVDVYSFLLGKSNVNKDLHTIGTSRGKIIHISTDANAQDFDTTFDSFLHGGVNNLFKASWSRKFDYDNLTYVSKVYSAFTAPLSTVNSSCIVQYRYSSDRRNYSSWITLTNNVDSLINREILAIEYRVILTDGWNGSAPVKPYITELYHVIINPSTSYIFTYPQSINGSLFEYILSPKSSIPETAKLSWGISRGDSLDWADYSPVISRRNGVLPNRQESILFTDEISKAGLSTKTSDYFIYQVYEENGSKAKWATTDIVTVRLDGIATSDSDGYYSLDNVNGLIYFSTEKPSTVVVTIDITTPSAVYKLNGELTTTIDNRTYYLSNGRYPIDSTIIVLKNSSIVRGGYFENRESGTITFTQEQNDTDKITVYVAPSEKFRVGIQIKNYTNVSLGLLQFGLTYTTIANSDLENSFVNSPSPTIYPGTLQLLPSIPNISERLYIEYKYVSVDNNKELDTKTEWYRSRSNGAYLRVNTSNSMPNYDNRTVQKLSDLNSLFISTDKIKVIVKPSDGITTGISYESNIATLLGTKRPFVYDVSIACANKTTVSGVNYVTEGTELKARYIFNDGEVGSSNIIYEGQETSSSISWFYNDELQPIATKAILPSNLVVKGKTISFIVKPYDGSMYGDPVRSEDITVS